jgi:hypothetical protein
MVGVKVFVGVKVMVGVEALAGEPVLELGEFGIHNSPFWGGGYQIK